MPLPDTTDQRQRVYGLAATMAREAARAQPVKRSRYSSHKARPTTGFAVAIADDLSYFIYEYDGACQYEKNLITRGGSPFRLTFEELKQIKDQSVQRIRDVAAAVPGAIEQHLRGLPGGQFDTKLTASLHRYAQSVAGLSNEETIELAKQLRDQLLRAAKMYEEFRKERNDRAYAFYTNDSARPQEEECAVM